MNPVRGLTLLYERGKRPAEVGEADHVNFNAAHGNRTIYPKGDFIGIVAHPNRHFLTSFEDGAFDEQGFELDSTELPIAGIHFFFADITDVYIEHLIVQEHGEGDFIAGFVFIEIDVTGVIDGRDHILYAGRHLKCAGGAYCGGVFPVKAHVIVFLVAAFVDIADKAHGEQGGGIDIAFVAVAHFEEPVVRAVGFTIAHYVVCIPVVVFNKRAVKGSFAGANEHVTEIVKDFQGDGFACPEAGVDDPAEVILRIRCGGNRQATKQQ